MKGKFKLIIGDKIVIWDNHIMDQGVQKLGRILADSNENNINLIRMSVGTSDATPDDTTLTALVAEVGSKYVIGSWSVNSVYPFDLELTITIPADDITAGTFLKEVGIWFGPVGTEELFARAVNSTGIEVLSGQAVPVSYDLVIV